jgi:toxin ParE1/3/4
MAKVTRSARANADLKKIWRFIASDDPLAATRFVRRIGEVLESLAVHPKMGKLRPELAPDMRFYPVGNYLIFYAPQGNGILVGPSLS